MENVNASIDRFLVVAEGEEGHYEPVALASTPFEAEERARADFARRLRLLEQDEDPGMCPYLYRIWECRQGEYEPVEEIIA